MQEHILQRNIWRLFRQRDIWRLFRFFLVTKTRTKTVNCNSHNENCEDFLISDWILRKVEENISFSAQTCDHFIATSWIHEAYHLLNFFQNSITDTWKWIIEYSTFFIWRLCWTFLWKVMSAIFFLVYFVRLKESTCKQEKIFFTSLRKLFSFLR